MKLKKALWDITYIVKASWCLFLYKLRDFLLWFGEWLLLGAEKLLLLVEKLVVYSDELSDKIEEEDRKHNVEN